MTLGGWLLFLNTECFCFTPSFLVGPVVGRICTIILTKFQIVDSQCDLPKSITKLHFGTFGSFYLASSGPKSMAGAALKSATHSILFLRICRRIFIPLFLHNPAIFPRGGGAVKCVGQDAAVSATF